MKLKKYFSVMLAAESSACAEGFRGGRQGGLETFRKIVRHELCHYHLYFQGKGYKHVDRDFKDLLAKVEGLRYAPKMQGQKEKYYLYQCQSCGHIYRRKRRVNTQKFGCGLCRGKLIFLNQS